MTRILAFPSSSRRARRHLPGTATTTAAVVAAPATAVPAAILLLLGSLLWIGFYLLHHPREGVSVARTMQVAADVAVAGDLDAFAQWYDGLAVGLWRFSWPGFFAGHALVAAGLRRTAVLPRWATRVAIGGATVAVTAPVASVVAPGVSIVAFVTPILSLLWMAWLAVTVLRAPVGDAEVG